MRSHQSSWRLGFFAVTVLVLLLGCRIAERLPAPPPVVEEVTVVPAPPLTSDAIFQLEGALQRIYAEVSPSVVYLEVWRRAAVGTLEGSPFGLPSPDQLPQGPIERGSGSGFVWDTEGHIVTNYHVVEGAEKIRITFSDGTIVAATAVGGNRDSDLAVLRVDLPADRLHPVRLGDSNAVVVGELAVAIGNPFGLESTMTVGFISGLGRTLPVAIDQFGGPTYSIPEVIQTDAPINPGNSGGVLVNDHGKVVGVTTAIASPIRASAGVGFAVPSTIVERVVPALIDDGYYSVPWLGVSGTTLMPEVAKAMGLAPDQRGVLVVDVLPDSPADAAGLQGSDREVEIEFDRARIGGDVIIEFHDQSIQRFEDLSAYLFLSTEVGQQVTITILREGELRRLRTTLRERPERGEIAFTEPGVVEEAWLGILGITLAPEIAVEMALPENQRGVLIQEVVGGSPADDAGLRGGLETVIVNGQRVMVGGDVIIRWNNTTIADLETLRAGVTRARPGQTVTLTLLREGRRVSLDVTLAARPVQ